MIYFTFIRLCELLVPIFLVEFLFQFYILIGWRFVIPDITLGSIGLVNTYCKRDLFFFF